MAAPKYKRHVPKDGSRHRLTTYIAVSLFVLVDVALIGWALNSTRGAPAAPQTEELPVATAPQLAPTETSTPEPTAAASTFILTEAVTPTRIITALNATTAWRAQTGPCPATAAEPEYTLDGGVTWTKTDATGPTGVTAIQSIAVEADGIASLVALAGADCAPEFVKTFVSGENYRAYDEQLADTWHIDLADLSTIETPAGTVVSPCDEVVALVASTPTEAAALCSDQSIVMTDSSGVRWTEPVSVQNAVALSVSAGGYRLASVGQSDCVGIQVATISPILASVVTTGCLATDLTIDSEAVGISEAAGSIWIWTHSTVLRSFDGGTTWE